MVAITESATMLLTQSCYKLLYLSKNNQPWRSTVVIMRKRKRCRVDCCRDSSSCGSESECGVVVLAAPIGGRNWGSDGWKSSVLGSGGGESKGSYVSGKCQAGFVDEAAA